MHSLIKEFKSNLGAYAAIALGKLQALAIQQVQKIILEILEELKKACPPQDEVERLLDRVGKARAVVNGIEQKIGKIKPLPTYLDPIILAATIYVDIQKHRIDTLAPPVALPGGVPNFPQKTTGQITTLTDKVDKWNRFVETLQDDQKAIRDMLLVADGVFIPILTALNLIESLLEACLGKEELSDEERKALIEKAQGKTQEIFLRGISYRSKSGKTYTIKVIKDPNSPDIAPKRQAIAQDFRGITVLTGPSSFASSPQVLVDELKFRIDNQLP